MKNDIKCYIKKWKLSNHNYKTHTVTELDMVYSEIKNIVTKTQYNVYVNQHMKENCKTKLIFIYIIVSKKT